MDDRSEESPSDVERDEIVDRHKRLVLRTVLVSALTLGSRILGFVREMLSAALFGDTSGIYDAFITAWRVPNLFRRFLGEGALSTALQTAITEADGDGGNEAGRRLFLRTVSVAVWLVLGVCAVAMVAAWLMPDAMPFTGWSWLGADPGPVRELTVRLMPFLLVICVAALCAGALQVRGHFVTPNAAPALLNAVWIATLLYVGYRFAWGEAEGAGDAEGLVQGPKCRQMDMVRVLAWGVLLAGSAQLLVQLPALARFGFLRRDRSEAGPDPDRVHASAWQVIKISAPMALGAAVYQINVMVDGFMAEGLLPDGGPAAHYFANRIEQFPLALIAIAATSAVFPALNALGHRRRFAELRVLHDKAQLAVCFLALPATVGLVLLSEPISAVLFQHGKYEADGVARIAAALRMLAFALLPVGAVGLVGRTYYALGDYKTPVRISIITLVVNIGLNTVLVAILGMDVEGLALATAISSWMNLALLLPGLRTKLRLPAAAAGIPRRVAVMLGAGLVSGAAAWSAHRLCAMALATDPARWDRSVPALAAGALAGMGAYLALAHVLRVPEWAFLRARLAGRRSGS
ncbi:MAG: murein biosynthesis integral membrane protein MurJ [Planctomycetota bacterium]|nr:murein biosynthesis integral membrane protein MurJ [Planctomycetota bacterium]